MTCSIIECHSSPYVTYAFTPRLNSPIAAHASRLLAYTLGTLPTALAVLRLVATLVALAQSGVVVLPHPASISQLTVKGSPRAGAGPFSQVIVPPRRTFHEKLKRKNR